MTERIEEIEARAPTATGQLGADLDWLLAQLKDREKKLEAVKAEYTYHKFSEARLFMQRVGRILKGGE